MHSRRHVHARVHVQANAPCILSIGQEGKATAHGDVRLLAELASAGARGGSGALRKERSLGLVCVAYDQTRRQ